MTELPKGFVTVVDADEEGYKLVMFNGENRLNFSGGYTHGVYVINKFILPSVRILYNKREQIQIKLVLNLVCRAKVPSAKPKLQYFF